MMDFRVEKILKGSLDSIPSPSVKIQIIGGAKAKHLETKSLLTSPRNVLPYYLEQTFPPIT